MTWICTKPGVSNRLRRMVRERVRRPHGFLEQVGLEDAPNERESNPAIDEIQVGRPLHGAEKLIQIVGSVLEVPFNTIPVRSGRLGHERCLGVELHEVATPAPELPVVDYAHGPEAAVRDWRFSHETPLDTPPIPRYAAKKRPLLGMIGKMAATRGERDSMRDFQGFSPFVPSRPRLSSGRIEGPSAFIDTLVSRMANSGGVLWPEHGVGAPVSLCSENPRFFGRPRHADSQIAVRWRGEHLVDVCVISGQISVAL
jgi:hypothetical protein